MIYAFELGAARVEARCTHSWASTAEGTAASGVRCPGDAMRALDPGLPGDQEAGRLRSRCSMVKLSTVSPCWFTAR